jgi:hypothetical protein
MVNSQSSQNDSNSTITPARNSFEPIKPSPNVFGALLPDYLGGTEPSDAPDNDAGDSNAPSGNEMDLRPPD